MACTLQVNPFCDCSQPSSMRSGSDADDYDISNIINKGKLKYKSVLLHANSLRVIKSM